MAENKDDVKIGVYVCHCGSNIAGTVDVEDLTRFAQEQTAVAVARNYKFMCSEPGQALILLAPHARAHLPPCLRGRKPESLSVGHVQYPGAVLLGAQERRHC
jgi:hypothetical protein